MEKGKVIKDYRESKGLNFSLLTTFYNGSGSITEEKESDSLTFGAALDCHIFTPELFKKQFLISKSNVPTAKMKIFCDNLDGLNKESYLKAYEAAGFKISIDKVLSDFGKDFLGYYNELKSKLQVLSQDEAYNIEVCKNKLTHDQYVSHWFEDSEYQFPIYWRYMDIDCKSLLDIVKIDHEKKLIIGRDLKSTYNVYWFENSFRKYKYFIQAAFYQSALKYLRDTLYPEYNVGDFGFIAVDQKNPPMEFIMPNTGNWIKIGEFGGIKNNLNYRGFKELIEDYLFYKETNSPYPRTYVEKEGVVILE